MSAQQDMEHNDQRHSNEMTPPPNLTRDPRFSTMMSSTSPLLGEEIMSALSTPENSSEEDRNSSYGTQTELDRNSSSGGLSDILECREDAIHSSQSEESSSKGDNGRPPLAPPSETAPAANLPQLTSRIDHHQSQSMGEYSFMSAITETSSGEGDPAERQIPDKTSRNRTVSWDQNFFDSAGVSSALRAASLEPALQHELSPQSKRDSPRHRRRTSTLDLADLKKGNPMETEAENAIRAALEEESRVKEMRSRIDSASALMPQVSDKSLDLFGSNSTKSNIPTSPESHSPQTLNRKKNLNLTNLKKGNPMETEAETAIIAAIEKESRIEEMSGRADSASILMPHVPDEGLDIFDSNSTKSKIRDLKVASPNSMKSVESLKVSLSSSAGKTHRRKKSTMPSEGLAVDQSETLESTLTGLADAMRMIHIESTEHADQKEIERNHRRLPSRDIGHPAATMESIPVNNADVLVQNANLLLRQNIPRDDSSQNGFLSGPEPSRAPAQELKPVWKIFDTTQDPKKTDGDHLDDVQEGSSDESVGSNLHDTDSVSMDIEGGRRDCMEDDDSRPTTVGAPGKKKAMKKAGRIFERAKRGMLKGWDLFVDFLRPKQVSIAMYCRVVFLYLLLPIAGVAAFLFYAAGNPVMTGRASISWLLLFVARQIVTFTLSKATSLLVIDFLSLRTQWTVRLFGPTVALFIVQSKGFPFLVSMWSIYNFIFLSGEHKLANHWLFWQDLIAMCNKNNPSGGIYQPND